MRILLILSLLCFVGVSGCSDKVEPDVTNMLIAYPNPFRDVMYLDVNNTSTQDAFLKVFDPEGNIIADATIKPGIQRYSIDTYNRPSGKYPVVYNVGAIEYTEELIKL